MTKYYVTYCVMDGDTGSNIFWHACLILSKQEEPNGPITALDSVGFYSDVVNTTTNPIVKALKNLFGCRFNLQDCHGQLKKEEMRYLDGNGLHGISFEATQEQIDALIALYRENMALEETAIQELNHELTEQAEPLNSFTRFVLEKAKASLDGRSSRLQPFHLTMSINYQGFDSTASTTCKTYALNLLLQTTIIDQSTHDAILGSKGAYALPRYSGVPIAPLRLVSTGEPEAHESRRTKAIFYNRTWERNSLFWASSLNIYQPMIPSNIPLKPMIQQHLFIKNILNRTKSIEINLRRQIHQLEYEPEELSHLTDLKIQLQRVLKVYEMFKNSHENQLAAVLDEKLWRANRTLNIAEVSLNSDQINHSFMMRALASISGMGKLLSLLVLMILNFCFDEPVQSFAMTGLAFFTGYQLMKFAQEEVIHAQKNDDYRDFLQKKPEFELESQAPQSSLA